MKYFLAVCCFMLCYESYSQNSKSKIEFNPFERLNYNRVRVYRNLLNAVDVKPLPSDLKKRKGKSLSKKQIQFLMQVVTDTTTYGKGIFGVSTALDSYDFIFFNRRNEIVGLIGVSYRMHSLLSSPELPARTYYKQKFGNNSLALSSFSELGIARVRKLLIDLGMTPD